MNDEQQSVLTLKLRVTPELKQKIVESAEKYNRSMNADMVSRLEKSFSEQQTVDLSQLEQKINRLSTESREMRMLYIEAITGKNKLLEGLTLEDIQHILEAKLKQKDLQ